MKLSRSNRIQECMVHNGITTGGLQKAMLLVFMKEKANEGRVWTLLCCSPPLHTASSP